MAAEADLIARAVWASVLGSFATCFFKRSTWRAWSDASASWSIQKKASRRSYERFGFKLLSGENASRMFIPIATVRAACSV